MRREFGADNAQVLESAAMTSFARKLLRLGWKMSLQRPPMTFAFPKRGDAFDASEHELWFRSMDSNDKAAKVTFVVFPAVKQGEQKLSKAKVFLGRV